MSLPRTTTHGASFNKGAKFGTTGNESAAVPTHPVERSSAPKASAQPAYGSKKHTEYGAKPVNLGSITNKGRSSV
jgi:hypothetical protein